MKLKVFYGVISLAVCILFSADSIAADTFSVPLPSSVDASRIGQQISQPLGQQNAQKKVSAIEHKEKPLELSTIKGSEKIKFLFKKLEIRGNTVFTRKQLSPIFEHYLNHEVTLADIQKITHEITLKYRDAGYVLSRAILPAQVIQNGAVKIQIVEGYIGRWAVHGRAGRSKKLLCRYAERLSKSRPLNMKQLERYSLLANDIPGMQQVKTVLEPPQDKNATAGSADMQFVADFNNMSGFLSFDNRGTKYLGQNEYSAGISVNSLIQSGDQVGFQGVSSNHWHDMRYFNLYTNQPLGVTGSTLTLSGSISRTHPEFLLKPLKIDGRSQEGLISIQTPWLRTRKQNFYSIFSLDYLDNKSDLNLFHFNIYDDRIRSLRATANYSLQDSYKGLNQAGLQLSHGLPILGMSPASQPNLSRVKGDPEYTKWNLSLSRLQQITDKVSFFIGGMGQYAYQPLLSSEQLAYGGSQYGQAYDTAELTGDKGLMGKTELRYNATPQWRYLNNLQYFIFYDVGKVTNIEPQSVNGIVQNDSAASTGLGMRINFNSYLYGSGEIAKPLTRNVATMNDRNPRIFVSLTLTGKTKPDSDENESFNTGLTGQATNGPDAKAAASSLNMAH